MYTITLVASGLANGSLYALLALGLVLIYNTQDLVNFAHGELFMAGAFIGYATYQLFGWPYPVAFAASVGGGALLGVLIERGLVRPIADHPHVTLAMLTVGISYAMRGVVRLYFGGDIHTLPPLFAGASFKIGALVLGSQSVVNIAVAGLLTLAILVLFRLTAIGRKMRATQQNSLGARVVGIDTGKIYALTWGLASAIGAAAGFLAAPVTLVYPDMGAQFLLKAIAAAVLGGFGSAPGAIVGGLLIGVIEMLAGGFISTKLIDVSAYVVIIAVMMLRPQGLLGRASVARV